MTEKKLYTVNETSKILGIGRNLVYRLIKSDYLKALDLGGLKVPYTEIERFISESAGMSFKELTSPTTVHAS